MSHRSTLRNTSCLLLCGLALLPYQAVVAASPEDRACNLQGREIALRVSEEVSSDLSATERNRIAAIAAEVCAQYAADIPVPAANVPVVSRPAAPQSAAQSAPAPEAAPAAGEAEEKDEGGLFDFRVIDPEDRVQRPGLKRR